MASNITLSNFNDEEEDSLLLETTQYLWKIGGISQSFNPILSSYYIKNMQNIVNSTSAIELGPVKNLKMTYCPYCGALWRPNNKRSRTQSRPKLTKYIRKLFKLSKTRPLAMLVTQKKKLRNYQRGRNNFIYTCLNCHKRTKLNGNQKPIEPQLIQTHSHSNYPINFFDNTNSSRRAKRNNKKKSDRSKMFQVESDSFSKTPSLMKKSNQTRKVNEEIKTPSTMISTVSKKKAKRHSTLKDVLATEHKKNSSLADFLYSIN